MAWEVLVVRDGMETREAFWSRADARRAARRIARELAAEGDGEVLSDQDGYLVDALDETVRIAVVETEDECTRTVDGAGRLLDRLERDRLPRSIARELERMAEGL